MLTGGHPRVLVGDYFQNQTKKRKPLTSVSYSHLRGKDQSPVPMTSDDYLHLILTPKPDDLLFVINN